MAALTSKRFNPSITIGQHYFPLKNGATAFIGGMCLADPVNGYVLPGASGTAAWIAIGQFAQDLDNSAAVVNTNQVNVALQKEIRADWYDNATGAAAVVNLFSIAYVLDDHTVTATTGTNAIAGRVWAIDPLLGVAVENYQL